MEDLIISTGQVSLNIKDDNGDSRGTFKFNPTDILVAKKIINLKNDFQVKEEEFKVKSELCDTAESKISFMEELVDYFRNEIDNIFGVGSSQILFGNARVLEMFGSFFEGITPYYRKESDKRMAQFKKGGK